MAALQRLLLIRKRGDTADAWAQRVLRRGGTFDAAALAALRALDYDLAYFGIKQKMVYFNPRCGSNITAALTPMIARDGPGFDVVQSGTLAAWSEASGLLNSASGVVNLGVVVPRVKGINSYSCSMGMYVLNNIPASGLPFMRPLITGRPSIIGRGSELIVFDHNPTRNQSDNSFTSVGAFTKGLVCGTMWGTKTGVGGDGGVLLNGVIRGNTPFSLIEAPPFSPAVIVTALATSGGDFIAMGLTPDEISNLFWMLHAFNASLSTPRQVTAEGVS